MIEDPNLREQLHHAVESSPTPRISLEAVVRRGARRRRTRRALLIALAVIVAAPVTTLARDALDDASRPLPAAAVQPQGPSPAPGWTRYRDQENGFSVSYPSSWNRAEEVLTPALDAPIEVLTVGTASMVPDGEKCAQYPENAIEAMATEDVLLSIQETATPLGGEHTIERPEHFSLTDGYVSTVTDCLPESHSLFAGRMIPFRDSGRSFYAIVVFGPSASDETKSDLSVSWTPCNSTREQVGSRVREPARPRADHDALLVLDWAAAQDAAPRTTIRHGGFSGKGTVMRQFVEPITEHADMLGAGLDVCSPLLKKSAKSPRDDGRRGGRRSASPGSHNANKPGAPCSLRVNGLVEVMRPSSSRQ